MCVALDTIHFPKIETLKILHFPEIKTVKNLHFPEIRWSGFSFDRCSNESIGGIWEGYVVRSLFFTIGTFHRMSQSCMVSWSF